MENAVIQLTVSFLTVAVFVGIKQHFTISIPAEDWKWILLLGLVNTGTGCYGWNRGAQSKVQRRTVPEILAKCL